jgi:hypothetical protein
LVPLSVQELPAMRLLQAGLWMAASLPGRLGERLLARLQAVLQKQGAELVWERVAEGSQVWQPGGHSPALWLGLSA